MILQSNLHDKGQRSEVSYIYLTFIQSSVTELKHYIHHLIQDRDQKYRYTFQQSWDRQFCVSNLAYEAVTDILRTRHEQLSYDKYRSSDDIDLQSDLQPILCTNLHSDLHTRSTSRSAEHSTCKSTRFTRTTRNLKADL